MPVSTSSEKIIPRMPPTKTALTQPSQPQPDRFSARGAGERQAARAVQAAPVGQVLGEAQVLDEVQAAAPAGPINYHRLGAGVPPAGIFRQGGGFSGASQKLIADSGIKPEGLKARLDEPTQIRPEHS